MKRALLVAFAVILLELPSQVFADPPSEKTFSRETAGALIEPAIQINCNKPNPLRDCFPKALEDCSKSMRTSLEACSKKLISELPDKVTEDKLTETGRRTFACATEAFLQKHDKEMLQTGDCKKFVAALKSRLAEAKASNFAADSSASSSTDLVFEGVPKSLVAIRCKPEVVQACFRVGVEDCQQIYSEAAQACSKSLRGNYGDTVTRDQGGEIGKKMDLCTGDKFLKQVAQPKGPTAECQAAMKKYWQ